MSEFYQAVIECYQCSTRESIHISKQFSVRCYTDREGTPRWVYAKGDRKPRGWFVDEEQELNFYNAEGNFTDPSPDIVGVIFGVCPKCLKAGG